MAGNDDDNGHWFTQILNLVLRLPGLSSDAKLVYMGLQRGSYGER